MDKLAQEASCKHGFDGFENELCGSLLPALNVSPDLSNHKPIYADLFSKISIRYLPGFISLQVARLTMLANFLLVLAYWTVIHCILYFSA